MILGFPCWNWLMKSHSWFSLSKCNVIMEKAKSQERCLKKSTRKELSRRFRVISRWTCSKGRWSVGPGVVGGGGAMARWHWASLEKLWISVWSLGCCHWGKKRPHKPLRWVWDCHHYDLEYMQERWDSGMQGWWIMCTTIERNARDTGAWKSL